ncbi:hypothetical protein ACLK2I_21900 [Escherichia coli]
MCVIIPFCATSCFQIDYLTTLSNQRLFPCCTIKSWMMSGISASPARSSRRSECASDWSATKTKMALDVQDYIDERLPGWRKEWNTRQVENSFTQPNAAMNIQMLEWALDVTKGSKGDLLELYSGNGNFSLALARNFNGY